MATTRELTIARSVPVRRRQRRDIAGIVLWVVCGLVFAFLLAPLAILLLTSFTASRTVEFPPAGLSLQWYGRLVDTLLGRLGARPGLTPAIWFSVRLGVITAALSVATGVLAAL